MAWVNSLLESHPIRDICTWVPIYREGLAWLVYSIESDLGFSALTAEPGMGKTTLLFYVLQKFRTSARTALLFHTSALLGTRIHQQTNRGRSSLSES